MRLQVRPFERFFVPLRRYHDQSVDTQFTE